MTTLEILTDIERAGVNITAVNDQLRCEAPKGCLTDNLREQLRTHKAELLALLGDKSYWTRLAGTKADPDEAWEEQDIVFLTACEALRAADSEKHLSARWNGLKYWLSRNLSQPAMLALSDLFCSLKANRDDQEGK